MAVLNMYTTIVVISFTLNSVAFFKTKSKARDMVKFRTGYCLSDRVPAFRAITHSSLTCATFF